MLRTIFDPYSDLFLEYIETSKKNDMQTNHYHDTYELFFVVKGIRYIFLDGVCHVLNPDQTLPDPLYAESVLGFLCPVCLEFCTGLSGWNVETCGEAAVPGGSAE